MNRNQIFLLLINLFLVLKEVGTCSCLTSSPHGIWNWGLDCNTDPSCDSCPLGCFRNYKKTIYDSCYDWNDVDIFECVSCPAFCDQCPNSATCTTCISGYSKTSSGECISCAGLYGTGCTYCSYTSCTLC